MNAHTDNAEPAAKTSKAPPRRTASILLLLATIALLLTGTEAAIRITGALPSITPLMETTIEGRHFLYPTRDYYLFQDVEEIDDARWDINMFLAEIPKPPNTVRFLVLGESAAIGDPPESAPKTPPSAPRHCSIPASTQGVPQETGSRKTSHGPSR